MKNILIILVVLLGIIGLSFVFKDKNAEVVPPVVDNTEPIELCFGFFTAPNERGFADRYTLQMLLDNENGKVTGELNFLPGEKDSKVGKYEGTVSAVDKVMMARTIEATWSTFGEGINAEEPLKIIFGEGTASIVGFGLELGDIDCNDLTVRANIDKYLRENISALSPVSAVLGGTWYVIGVATDLKTNSGVVVYEDGHIMEKRNFSFTVGDNGEVLSVKIE